MRARAACTMKDKALVVVLYLGTHASRAQGWTARPNRTWRKLAGTPLVEAATGTLRIGCCDAAHDCLSVRPHLHSRVSAPRACAGTGERGLQLCEGSAGDARADGTVRGCSAKGGKLNGLPRACRKARRWRRQWRAPPHGHCPGKKKICSAAAAHARLGRAARAARRTSPAESQPLTSWRPRAASCTPAPSRTTCCRIPQPWGTI